MASGAGANTQNSEGMWNWWGRLFAAIFVAVILVAVSVFVAAISVADLPL